MFGQEATLKSLLDHGADVNVRASNGKSALHEASMCYYRRANNVRMLLEHGADPSVVDLNTGQTLLHHPLLRRDAEAVKLLLNHGANPNAETTRVSRGKTPLIEVARNGLDPKVVKLLLYHGANPNARDHSWHTNESALHIIVASEKEEMLKSLLEYGADIGIKDADGRTPVQKAPKSTNTKRLLEGVSA